MKPIDQYPTPLTDAACVTRSVVLDNDLRDIDCVDPDFARTLEQQNAALREALETEINRHSEFHDWALSKLRLSNFEGGAPTVVIRSLNQLQDARAVLAATEKL